MNIKQHLEPENRNWRNYYFFLGYYFLFSSDLFHCVLFISIIISVWLFSDSNIKRLFMRKYLQNYRYITYIGRISINNSSGNISHKFLTLSNLTSFRKR